MDRLSTAHFEADTQFRRAWALVARRGRVLIRDGHLTLLNRAGQQVASAPVHEVHVKRPWWTLGSGCYAAFASATYYLTLRSFGQTFASGALGGSIAQAAFGREATDTFVDALERERGTAA